MPLLLSNLVLSIIPSPPRRVQRLSPRPGSGPIPARVAPQTQLRTVKQHVLLDAVGAIAVVEGVYFAADRIAALRGKRTAASPLDSAFRPVPDSL